MQKIFKFNSNRITGLIKKQAYKVTVVNNGKLFLKQRVTLPEAYAIYAQKSSNPIEDDFLEKGLYVIENNNWSPKTSEIAYELLKLTIETQNVKQTAKILDVIKSISSKLSEEDIVRLKLHVEGLKIVGKPNENIDEINTNMNELIEQAFKENILGQRSYYILNTKDNEVKENNSELISFAETIFDFSWSNKIIEVGTINLILSQNDVNNFSDHEKVKFENLLARSILGLTLSQLCTLIGNNNLNSRNLSYDTCLKIEKGIGIMVGDIDWANCGNLFKILNNFHELRPKFLQLIRNEIADNIDKISAQDSLIIIEFLYNNRINDINLLKQLNDILKLDSQIQPTKDQEIILKHIDMLINHEFDPKSIEGNSFIGTSSEKIIFLLSSLISAKLPLSDSVVENFSKLLTNNFIINDDFAFGRSILDWTEALYSLKIDERNRFYDINKELLKAINDSQKLDKNQKEWALDTLALVVD